MDAVLQYLSDLSPVAWCVIGVGSFVGSIIFCAVLLLFLPIDYFVEHSRPKLSWPETPGGWVLRIARNLAGLFIALLGVMMLFGPGQGVLFLLIGLLLTDFPGKHRLVRKLLRSGKVVRGANNWRAKFGKPPMTQPDGL